MSEIQTRFRIGDVVFKAATVQDSKQHPCPDCLGSRKWTATSPAGGEYTFECPRCSTRFQSHDALCLTYTVRSPSVAKLTIGSIRVDTADNNPVSYMCRETGIGSGTIHYEHDLFATEEEATAAANLRAAKETAEIDWISKLYDKTLSLSDYQLENAVTAATRKARIDFEVAADNLINDLDESETRGDVRARVDEFKKAIAA